MIIAAAAETTYFIRRTRVVNILFVVYRVYARVPVESARFCRRSACPIPDVPERDRGREKSNVRSSMSYERALECLEVNGLFVRSRDRIVSVVSCAAPTRGGRGGRG